MSPYASRTVWVQLPSTWLRVVARVTETHQRDLLERTILRLVRLAPRTDAELARMLGDLPLDVVGAALERLVADGMLHVQGDPPLYLTVPDEEEGREEPLVGWVGLSPADAAAIPEVIVGRLEGSTAVVEGIETIPLDGEAPFPAHAQPDALLRAAVRRGVDVFARGKLVVSGDDWRRVSSLVSDLGSDGRLTQLRGTCWSRVDIVPSVTGAVETVFHEPALVPRADRPKPVSAALAGWIREHAGGTWRRVEEVANHCRVENTLVLRMAGFKDLDAVDREVSSHCTSWRARLGPPDPFAATQPEVLAQQLREAHRWLILWRAEPSLARPVTDAFAHGIEAMAQALANGSLPSLRSWAARVVAGGRVADAERARWKRPSAYVEALAPFGLEQALKPSEPHLRLALASVHLLPEQLERPHGAGASITLWLLPLFLGTDAERNAFASRVAAGLAREPAAFDLLDDLILLRNEVAHVRQERMKPERLDELVTRVLWAFAPGNG